ncbi:MAG: tRNA dihydrouridine synthase [Bdellovibrio sp.]
MFLAPMEGVMDHFMRDVLTRLGGIDQTVCEFIRITDQTTPDAVFFRDAPELKNQSRTPAGTPVFIQLLGGDVLRLAEHARIAVRLGAIGVDLNFGCPAKTVNRHDGGATLLLYPERMQKIVRAVRDAVPAHIPVTAKIRLGFTDPSACIESASAVAAGGADWITVHCRTKMDMYKPPAYWNWIPEIKKHLQIPVIANGDIFNVQDLKACAEVTGCDQFMIGRGALIDPFIFCKIKGLDVDSSWRAVVRLVQDFFVRTRDEVSPAFAQARTKQWLRELAKGHHPQAKLLFDEIKVLRDPELLYSRLLMALPQTSELTSEGPSPRVTTTPT